MILLTGGTGSFGRAYIRHLGPNVAVTVYSRDEEKQRRLALEFGWVRCMVGDVRDRDRLTWAAHGATLIIHAAALKQVPACENNPTEALRTNVLGAENAVAAAGAAGARLVALSTDKAVEPVNAYGATKMLAERVVLNGGGSVVRYGNVIGSRGSVVPVFLAQIGAGQPLTITDPDMTRFLLTLPQAIALVEKAVSVRPGRIIVAKPPAASIATIATALAGPTYPRVIVGSRPGEKRHERLVSASERAVERDDHFIVEPGAPAGIDYSSDFAPSLDAEALGALLAQRPHDDL